MHKRKIRLGLILITLLAFVSGCDYPGVSGPYSTAEIGSKLDQIKSTLPIYVPRSESPYADIALSFYYYYNGSSVELRTFFFSRGHGGQSPRIAKMMTSWMPPALDDALKDSEHVMVRWANESTASTCKFTPGTVRRDSFPGDPYKTCVVWWSGEHTFLFYSALPLDETLVLINSLVKIR